MKKECSLCAPSIHFDPNKFMMKRVLWYRIYQRQAHFMIRRFAASQYSLYNVFVPYIMNNHIWFIAASITLTVLYYYWNYFAELKTCVRCTWVLRFCLLCKDWTGTINTSRQSYCWSDCVFTIKCAWCVCVYVCMCSVASLHFPQQFAKNTQGSKMDRGRGRWTLCFLRRSERWRIL